MRYGAFFAVPARLGCGGGRWWWWWWLAALGFWFLVGGVGCGVVCSVFGVVVFGGSVCSVWVGVGCVGWACFGVRVLCGVAVSCGVAGVAGWCLGVRVGSGGVVSGGSVGCCACGGVFPFRVFGVGCGVCLCRAGVGGLGVAVVASVASSAGWLWSVWFRGWGCSVVGFSVAVVCGWGCGGCAVLPVGWRALVVALGSSGCGSVILAGLPSGWGSAVFLWVLSRVFVVLSFCCFGVSARFCRFVLLFDFLSFLVKKNPLTGREI